MIIFWSGLGFLVAVIIFGFALAFNVAFDAWQPGYWDAHKWPFGASLLLSAAVCWFLGTALRKRGAQTVIDKATAQEIVLDRSNHSLFFIPVHLWAPLLAIGGVIACAMDLAN